MKTLSILLIMISACNIIPRGYSENLIGTWNSTENINTPTGNATITYTSLFTSDKKISITINHPVNGQSTQNFLYEVGYFPPKPSFIYLDLVTKKVLNTPNYFYFSNNFTILVTSTNANMFLSRIWKK